ncbi:ecto-ADP-ribosyltransferase 4-like [Salarias fasciatus]|uniref:ecto-ADP-ribosyltransferase 4-like n=1 Tax=Salarias fasciatus TaxID=181472 RepID=UPI001176AEF4|nr:ecto-ADP-ribosyltransferase 4-like [Salarias fasciatus]
MQAVRKKTSTYTVASLVIFMGLLTFIMIHLLLSWPDSEVQGFSQDVSSDYSDTFDDCTSAATVVTDTATMQKWDACQANFSRSWRNTKQNIGVPVHQHMQKHHSLALYMYIESALHSVKHNIEEPEKSEKEIFQPHSLYSSLSEAIQIVRHSQATCFHTNYRSEALLNLNMSNLQIRFSTFTLGLKEWNSTHNASCFEIYSCFGADVTYYSSLKHNKQVLIPPYEVFKVTDIQKEIKECRVIYRIKSNMNCVYDRDSNNLQPISVLPVQGLWLIFIIMCVIIIFLVLLSVIVKLHHKKTADYTARFLVNHRYPAVSGEQVHAAC